MGLKLHLILLNIQESFIVHYVQQSVFIALLQPFFSHLFISTYFLKDPILFKVAHSDQVIFMFFRSLINFMISAQNILKLFEYYMKLAIDCFQLPGLYNWILSRYTLLPIFNE
jgi:hypothetical protein